MSCLSKLKEKRENCNLSQKDLAEKLNVTQSTIAMWETGKALPRADKLPVLAKIFNCTVDELLSE